MAGLLAACGGGESGPRWTALAQGFEPPALLPQVKAWHAGAGKDVAEPFEYPGGVQVNHPLARSDWTAGADGTWSTALPGGAFRYGAPELMRVKGDKKVYGPAHHTPPEAGTFTLEGERVILHLEAGTEPEPELVLMQRLEQGRKTPAGAWEVRTDTEFGAGLPVWSGTSQELTCDVPERSRLTFEARFHTNAAPAPATLTVRLDGAVLQEVRLIPEEHATGRFVSLLLPEEGRARARFGFECSGPPGLGVFFRPMIGPAEIGSLGARPWEDARPDIVLFLADTFRADNLACYGGEAELAPNMNRNAAASLRFLQARSNAAWTLPSISTLLSGLTPGQHTANQMERALPTGIQTITERLASAGYRTGAITDGGFFTPYSGLEEGFESFALRDEWHWDLRWTVRRALAFLDQDDGRPVFLVVHTYRVHMPYRVGMDEDRTAWDALVTEFPLWKKKELPPDQRIARVQASSGRYRELYRAGVRGLDEGFGTFLAGLEQRRFPEHGFVLFTSDHGEALGENHALFHAGDLWDVKLRIPILVRGPGVAPADRSEPATTLDITPTLAHIARLPADPGWPGQSLLALNAERPSYAFRLEGKKHQIAVVDRRRKIVTEQPETLGNGTVAQAFDLASDPGEERDLKNAEPWTAELARQQFEAVRRLLAPATEVVQAQLTPDTLKALEALGYVGGEMGAEEKP